MDDPTSRIARPVPRYPRQLPWLLAAMIMAALLAAGCAERGSGEDAFVDGGGAADDGSGTIDDPVIAACLDTSRQAGFAISVDDCSALNDVGLLCEDGLPECGTPSGKAAWVRACQSINRYYLGGEPEGPLACSQAANDRQMCPNGWPRDPSEPKACNPSGIERTS